jgi:hypothetical protein
MKKVKYLSVITTALLFSSCGVNSALILNQNQNSTQVHLSSNNYRIVDKVTGSAEVAYILLIGGADKSQLYENAYTEMANKANLLNSSKALINIVTEEHIGGLPPFYYKRTITISANVIEFYK